MSTQDTRAAVYSQRISLLSGELASANSVLMELESRPSRLDSKIGGFPSRIANIRKGNYLIQTSLESDQAQLSASWKNASITVKDQIRTNAQICRAQIAALEGEVRSRSAFMDDPSHLNDLEARIQLVVSSVNTLSRNAQSALGSIESLAERLEQSLALAEKTVQLTQSASFKWAENECPVVAVNAKDMNKDVDGVLTLTNHRIILESVKEIVLKKTLFIATEKKKVREVAFEGPVGSINSLIKGRVGILAGVGLYIDFKPQAGLPPFKLDTKSDEADNIVRYYGLISSGQVDDELSKLSKVPEKEETKVIACPRCGAPYTDEIYRGQTTVTCKYCGSNITV